MKKPHRASDPRFYHSLAGVSLKLISVIMASLPFRSKPGGNSQCLSVIIFAK